MSRVKTVPQLLDERVAATPDSVAFESGGERVDWKTFGARTDALAMGLKDLGLAPGDAVGVMGQTTGEWAVADQGILAGGGVSVGLYPTLGPEQVAYQLADCEAKACIVGSRAELDIVREAVKDAPSVKTIVAWGDAEGAGKGVHDFSRVLQAGRGLVDKHPKDLAALKQSRGPDDTALLIYTSGTTGKPKGAMLSHWNCVFEVKTLASMLPMEGRSDHTVSFLPMAHVAEHVIGFYGRINMGVATYFVGSMDSQQVLDAVQSQRPTIFGSVPRIFEKAYARIQSMVAEANPRRQAIFRWAEALAQKKARAAQGMGAMGISDRLQHGLADRLVFKKIRDRFGGQVGYFVCGAAPIDVDILEFFYGAGLQVVEVYGLTECTGVATANRVDQFKFGTVGLPIPQVEVRLAEDHEILIRGENIFQGYLGMPEATAEAVDEDGWLHTGDIGEFEDGGWLRITDRKKNIIVTSGGKNVAPAGIEALLASETLLGPVVIIGDRQPYLTALVTLDPEEARKITGAGTGPDDFARSEEINNRVRAAFEKANAALAQYERVRRFRVLPVEFTVESGDITPTLKVRRKSITEKYQGEIAGLYADPAGPGVVQVVARG